MPPRAKFDASIILFDLNVSKGFYPLAKNCLLDIHTKKWFMKSNDLTKLLFVNDEQAEDTQYMRPVTNFVNYNPGIVKRKVIESNDVKTESSSANVDFLEALLHALTLFDSDEIKGCITKQIILITDFSNGHIEDSRRVRQVINGFNDSDSFLYIIGPEMVYTQMLKDIPDIREWSRTTDPINRENSNIRIANNIVRSIENAVMCNLDVGWQIFSYFKRWHSPQPFALPLSIGSKIHIDQKSFRFIKNFDYPKVRRNVQVRHVLASDSSVEVEFENTARGFLAHDKLIPITEDVKKSIFKTEGPRMFKLMGFTHKSNIPEYFFCEEGSIKMRATEGVQGLKKLVHIMDELKVYGIVARRYIQNTKAKYFALIPVKSQNCFNMAQLPFAEACRVSFTDQDPKTVPRTENTEITDKVYGFLDRLDSKSGENKLRLSPELVHNPHFVKSMRVLRNKCLKMPLDVEEERIVPQLKIDDDILEMVPVKEVKVKPKRDKTDDH